MSYFHSAPVAPSSGGGSSGAAWTRITGWGAYQDPSSLATGGYEDTDGTVVLPLSTSMGQIDGITEAWPGFGKRLTDVFPDWTDATDTIELFLEIAAMPMPTSMHKAGVFAAVASAAPSGRASATAAGACVYPNAVSAVNLAQMNSATLNTGFGAGTNLLVPTGMFARVDFASDGTMRIVPYVRRSDGTFSSSPALIATAVAGPADPDDRFLWIGGMRVSATATAAVVAARLYARQIRSSRVRYLDAGAKRSTPRTMVLFGHSIGYGVAVGGDATYGGASVPAGITLIDAGSVITSYPNNAGSGPDPSVLPYWANFMGSGTIIRRTTSGAVLAQIETQQLISAMSDLVTAGIAPSTVDAVVCMIGENDANDSTESAAYTARISQVCQVIERAFPNARILWQDMRSEDAAYSEYATIRSANAAAVALGATRRLVPYTGIALSDAVHYAYTSDGYALAGALQVAAYQAAG
jgi:hypothetical protein